MTARVCVAIAAIVVTGAALPPAEAPAQDRDPTVQTATTEPRSAERVKTVRIGRKPWQRTTSVVSLPPSSVGPIHDGDRVEASLDLEVTICLKPNANHGGGKPCVGKMYGYDPKFKTQLVLARSKTATGGRKTVPISAPKSSYCKQKQPNRNHHCVISIPWKGVDVPDASALPCPRGRCHVNAILTAYHRNAGSGEKVVLGSSDDRGRISQGRAKLSTAVFHPGDQQAIGKLSNNRKRRKKIPVGRKGGKKNFTVLYSLPIQAPNKGEQFLVEGKATLGIGGLPYNVFMRSELVLADSPGSTTERGSLAGRIADTPTRIGVSNGANCTLGSSAFRSPCTIRKSGILSIRESTRKTVYANLVVGQSAIGSRPMYSRWKSSDASKLTGGRISARKYTGSAACGSCQAATGGGRFEPGRSPGGIAGELVNRLRAIEIVQGNVNCISQTRQKKIVCNWSSSGRYGNSRTYKCEQKAFYYRKAKRWSVPLCKDAIGALLWHRLQLRGQRPNYTGGCRGTARRVRCKWNADVPTIKNKEYHCGGSAVYSRKAGKLRIDNCRKPDWVP